MNHQDYQGTMTANEILHGWAEGTRRGLRLQTLAPRIVTPDTLNEVMEFDYVIFSHGDGCSVSGVIGMFAPDAYQERDEHGEWAAPMIVSGPDSFPQWSLMGGYSGQYSYSGPWMHPSEFIAGGMAEDILRTPGFYVAIYPTMELGDEEFTAEPDTWAVAYIAENIPGSVAS